MDSTASSSAAGRFFGRAPVDPRARSGAAVKEFDPAQNFGAELRG